MKITEAGYSNKIQYSSSQLHEGVIYRRLNKRDNHLEGYVIKTSAGWVVFYASNGAVDVFQGDAIFEPNYFERVETSVNLSNS